MAKLKSKPLPVGSKAPDFTLKDQEGNDVRLYELLESGPVVVYFYPKAFTAVCTKEACGFRDNLDVFTSAGAQVVGVSADDVDTQKSFSDKHTLTFPVLSDKGSKVHALFGLRNGGGISIGWAMNDRVTFVVDQDGTIRHNSSALLKADVHVNEALDTVKQLLAESADPAAQ